MACQSSKKPCRSRKGEPMTELRSSRLLELNVSRKNRKESRALRLNKNDSCSGGRIESEGGGSRDRVASARDSTEIHDHSPAGPPS